MQWKKKLLKNPEYNKLVKKVNGIQTNDTRNLVIAVEYNTKIDEIEEKIPNHDEYIITQEFDKLTADHFAARLAKEKLATKADIVDFLKKKNFDEKLKNINKKVTSNKTRHTDEGKRKTR